MGKPRNTQKYPIYPEIPQSKKNTRKYLMEYFDTPTPPQPDPLPGILSNTGPDPILKKPTRWPLPITLAAPVLHVLYIMRQTLRGRSRHRFNQKIFEKCIFCSALHYGSLWEKGKRMI